MELKIKIWDYFFLAILILTILLSAIPILSEKSHYEGSTVHIEIDGAELAEIPLNEDAEIDIENIGKIIIKDSEVHIAEPTCKDKLCAKMGNISKSYHAIICLPNKVVISITDKNHEFDDIAG